MSNIERLSQANPSGSPSSDRALSKSQKRVARDDAHSGTEAREDTHGGKDATQRNSETLEAKEEGSHDEGTRTDLDVSGAASEHSCEAPPKKRRRTQIQEWSGYSGKRLSAEETCKAVAQEIAPFRKDAEAVCNEIGLALPTFQDAEVSEVLKAWATLPKVDDLRGKSESDQERYHANNLNALIMVLQKEMPASSLPAGSGSRRMLARKNKRIGFTFDPDETFPDGQGSKDFRPDCAIVKSSIRGVDLDGDSGFRHVHVPVECTTASGGSELGQVGAYSIAFRAPGSRYQVALSIRQTLLRLFIFSPTGWAVARQADYSLRNKAVAEILAFVVSDAARDDSLRHVTQSGLPLIEPCQGESLYNNTDVSRDRGLQFRVDADSHGALPRPFFSSERLWGARTQAWEVQGSIVTSDGDTVEEGTYILTCKLLRPGKAANSLVYSQRLREQSPLHARQGWFEVSRGLSLDLREMQNPRVQRMRVVEILNGPRWSTWDEVSQRSDVSVRHCFCAFRDCLRALWQMRPLHHRDISIHNLLIAVTPPAAVATDVPLVDSNPLPPFGRPFDFGNARWGSEPSDSKRRHQRSASLAQDDLWTGTYHFLSRAALLLDEATGEDDDTSGFHEETRRLVHEQGQHRHWHDAESLFLCLSFLLASRFRHAMPIHRLLDAWLKITRDDGELSFLQQAKKVMACLARYRGSNAREEAEIKAAMHALREMLGLLEGVVGEEDFGTDNHVKMLFQASESFERNLFEGLLSAANKAVDRIAEVDAAPRLPTLLGSEVPSSRSLRSRQVHERIA